MNSSYNALPSRGLQSKVGILADESNQLSGATKEYGSWLPQAVDKVCRPLLSRSPLLMSQSLVTGPSRDGCLLRRRLRAAGECDVHGAEAMISLTPYRVSLTCTVTSGQNQYGMGKLITQCFHYYYSR